HMSGSKISSARVVMGHVAPTPWVAESAEKLLVGKSISEAVAEDAGKAAVEGAQPLSQNGYKVQLAKVAVKRALLAAAGKAV
ncbi:MAG: FAD binding domain-containing protein, partial [Bryobacteraceae bacterium]